MVATQTIVGLIQLVALVLPAAVILLQVLNRLFEEPHVVNDDNELVPVDNPRTQRLGREQHLHPNVDDKWCYKLPKESVHFFIFAGFSLMAALGMKVNGLTLPLVSPTAFTNVALGLFLVGFSMLGAPLLLVEPSLLLTAKSRIVAWLEEYAGYDGEDSA